MSDLSVQLHVWPNHSVKKSRLGKQKADCVKESKYLGRTQHVAGDMRSEQQCVCLQSSSRIMWCEVALWYKAGTLLYLFHGTRKGCFSFCENSTEMQLMPHTVFLIVFSLLV